ncbi:hypothetical protein [Streptomyces hydrogenans]|uniref:hypothetical protein n=1 Tax=Streptomyces hydrogenans TaxID=1873719 RepID=UPI0035DF060A
MQHIRIPRKGPSAAISAPRPTRDAAEAALVEHYPALVRLAHLVLPPSLGRQRRVLAAHAVVQRALPRGGPARTGSLPRPRGPREEAHAWLRARVVTGALTARELRPAALALPRVTGLRLFPRAGGGDELALDRALAAVAPEVRAALALTVLEGLGPEETAALLSGAGVAAPDLALASAARLRATVPGDPAALLRGPEFDPCTVHLRPTDLLRRRRRGRGAVLAAALLLAAVPVAGALWPDAPAPAAAPAGSVAAPAADPAALLRADPERWADTSRVDFTAWPARGDRTADTALLGRALTAWTGDAVRKETTPRTSATPPAGPPALLYAGETDGAAVVLLHDGVRLARYTEPPAGAPVLVLARADDADVTTAASVVLARTGAGTRYLLAPWIAEAGVRDLAAPAVAARELAVAPDGVTPPVPSPPPAGTGGCGGTTVLQLRSSARIVEDHAFLVADLGGLGPAHLSWTPLPAPGIPSRQPREATGPLGLAAWARSGCLLGPLRDSGVRSVNRWEFAEQPLPERAGRALWVCARAETWEGTGRADVVLETPARAPATVRPLLSVPDTAACGRFGQDVLAGGPWTAPSGARYLLAAGSRHVVGITADGAVRARAQGRVFAARAPGAGGTVLDGRLADGGVLRGWTAGG